jgi:hypothetical protein
MSSDPHAALRDHVLERVLHGAGQFLLKKG